MGKIWLVVAGRAGPAGNGPAEPNQACPSRRAGPGQGEWSQAKPSRAEGWQAKTKQDEPKDHHNTDGTHLFLPHQRRNQIRYSFSEFVCVRLVLFFCIFVLVVD